MGKELLVAITPASCIPFTLRDEATELRKTSGAQPSHPRPARGDRPRGPPLEGSKHGQTGLSATEQDEEDVRDGRERLVDSFPPELLSHRERPFVNPA